MKDFTVKVVRTVVSEKTFTIRCETAVQAVNSASEMAQREDWSAIGSTTKYKIGRAEEIPNDYIDQYGEPYDSESGDSWPAGGGLHKDCEFNADALYAYYTIKNRYKIADYLLSKGFRETLHENDEQVWVKGNTEVTYESYADGMWGYMHTELI